MTLLYSKIIGEGKPFVILHGYLGMSDNWKTLGTQFAELGYEVHLVDLRNHGRSFHSDHFSYSLMVEDLKYYCDQKKLENIVLLGHSMGGKVAMEFAVQYPELVNKLIVVDISPRYYAPHHQDIMRALNAVDFDKKPSREEVENILRQYVKEDSVVLFLMKNVHRLTSEQLGYRFNLKSFNQNEEAIGKALPENARFDGEALFVKGGKSEYIQKTDEVLIHKHFNKAEIKTIEGAGHWVHADKPHEFYKIVSKILDK